MAAQQSWISYFSNLVKQYGGVNLAQGIPGFQPPEGLMEGLKRCASEDNHQYAPGTGNHNLRAHIFKMYEDKFSEEQQALMVTNGATEAIHLLYMSFHTQKARLRAAAFAPVYESYLHLPRIYGDEFYSLEMNNTHGDLPEKLELFFQKNQPDVFFVNSPGNPYGNSLDKDPFDRLVSLSARYKCRLLIDAVYDRIYFQEPPYYPFHDFHENVYFINSFSKLYSITGWRIGYFFCHPSKFDLIRDIHDYTGLCTPSVLQESLARFMSDSPEKDSYVVETRERIKRNLSMGKEMLEDSGFEVPVVKGGYFIWAKLPADLSDSIGFAKQLYKEYQTAIIPGAHFGRDYSNYIRINIARQYEELKAGIEHIVKLANNQQGAVV
ncbi:MAG: pyridoxal phosphate-dependent aminotransferase [Bacteroidales bacterium]